MRKLIGRLLCALGLHDDALDHDYFSLHAYQCSRCGKIHGVR